MEPARLCFISGHRFGYYALQGLKSGAAFRSGDIVITLLLGLDTAKQESTVGYYDFQYIASEVSSRFETIRSIKVESVNNLILNAQPDYILAIGWSELLPVQILDIPSKRLGLANRHGPAHGCIGMHPTLLPIGRGRAPIPWTIINSIQETGVTAFLLEEGPDEGGIVAQKAISVSMNETATSLFAKCCSLHFELGRDISQMLGVRQLTWTNQDDSRASYWTKRRLEDGRIRFEKTGDDICRLVRALTPPYPGAFFDHAGEAIIVDEVRVLPKHTSARPGTITCVNSDGLPHIAALDSVIECIDISRTKSRLTFRVGDSVSRTSC